MKKIIALISAITIVISQTACSSGSSSESSEKTNSQAVTDSVTDSKKATETGSDASALTAEKITSKLTLDQKAAQMVQGAVYSLSRDSMHEYCYGSVLSKLDFIDAAAWRETVDGLQEKALASEAGIPYLYGNDDVHGVNYCSGAVIFPHNIGIGAANDPELTYKMGLAVADEAKMCHMLWNFAPCIAQSADPRWGRTYESYSANLSIITELGASFTKGLVDGGIIACAKHFFADGNVNYGTGEDSEGIDRLMDRGNAELSDEEITALLDVYKAQIDAGVQTIMISHSALNGVKMHENAKYIKYLKNEMKFDGFIVSDWNSVQNTSPSTYEEQIITSVNAGIDMLMEVDTFEEARMIIADAVENGDITEERINDAVTRIIKVKLEAGIFEDPLCEKLETEQKEPGSDDYRQLAEQLVEKSLVLLKNDNDILPFTEGKTIYVTGPAANSARIQCGGWTGDWNQSPTEKIEGVTTILDGFKKVAAEHGINVVTLKDEAASADAVLLIVGEKSYAEWNGDTEDLELCGSKGLSKNKETINEVAALQKPTIACIVAGRQVILNDYDSWDAVVMCYLPGSEGQGVANVLCGKSNFTGKLPSPWYSSVDQIGTDDCWLAKGYGLTYK